MFECVSVREGDELWDPEEKPVAAPRLLFPNQRNHQLIRGRSQKCSSRETFHIHPGESRPEEEEVEAEESQPSQGSWSAEVQL